MLDTFRNRSKTDKVYSRKAMGSRKYKAEASRQNKAKPNPKQAPAHALFFGGLRQGVFSHHSAVWADSKRIWLPDKGLASGEIRELASQLLKPAMTMHSIVHRSTNSGGPVFWYHDHSCFLS